MKGVGVLHICDVRGISLICEGSGAVNISEVSGTLLV